MQIEITHDDGSSQEAAWELFVVHNADAFDAPEFAAMRASVEAGKAVTLGGGAAPMFTVRLAPEPRP